MSAEIKELMKGSATYWKRVVDELRESIHRHYPMSRGTFQQIGSDNRQPVTLTADGIRVTIWMPYYYDFMDKGVSGARRNTNRSPYRYTDKMPPIKAMRQFMQNRQIVGQNYRNLRARPNSPAKSNAINKELNRIAFAIARKIWRDGLRATHWYSEVINPDTIDEYADLIAEQYGAIIVDMFERTAPK